MRLAYETTRNVDNVRNSRKYRSRFNTNERYWELQMVAKPCNNLALEDIFKMLKWNIEGINICTQIFLQYNSR